MFGLAVMTGVIFVRFSRPVARLLFSDTMVIAPFDGKPTLMMRVANFAASSHGGSRVSHGRRPR